MPIFKTLRNGLVIGVSAVSLIFFLTETSIAEDDATAVVKRTAAEVVAETPTLHEENPENALGSSNGAYYKIDENSFAYYEKPRAYSFLLNSPLNIVDWLKDSFQKKNTLTIAGLTVLTAGLIAADQDLYRISHNIGRSLNITDDDRMGGRLPITSKASIKYPDNLGSAMYYLGDGMIPISITLGMLSYGLATSDVRSLQTSSQMAEGLISVAIVVQALKRTTGREVPRIASEPGGKWRFFPAFNEYNKHTPTYDAFPSGHLATTMMTITVLSDNYPEYTLIKPIGYGVMTILGFQMVNNGVHWVSDYPLAIAIGYGLGKVATSHGRKVVSTEKSAEKTSKRPFFTDMMILPVPIENGGAMIMVARF